MSKTRQAPGDMVLYASHVAHIKAGLPAGSIDKGFKRLEKGGFGRARDA